MTYLDERLCTDVRYEEADARGRIRQWKIKLAKDYIVYETARRRFQENGFRLLKPIALDIINCFRSGRKQAFARINKAFGPGVRLQLVKLDRGKALAIWSILKPRNSVCIAPGEQDCVTVDYVVFECSKDMLSMADGLWTLEVSDHALGRAIAGSHRLHPENLIRDAHACLLNLPSTVLKRADFLNHNLPGACIKAGTGCFVGHFIQAVDTSLEDNFGAHVRVWTWLDQHQLHEDQVILCEKGEPGKTLGDTWLQPNPLCDFDRIWANDVMDTAGRLS